MIYSMINPGEIDAGSNAAGQTVSDSLQGGELKGTMKAILALADGSYFEGSLSEPKVKRAVKWFLTRA